MKRQDLLTALEKVKPGLASRDQILQATSFAFMQGRIVTYNDEISISYKLPDIGIEGAVKADELYKFLTKASADEIEITTTESELTIKAGRAKVSMALQGEIKLPLQELGEIKGWKPLPTDFMDAINVTKFCCSKDMSKPILTCINFIEFKAISCDNYRIMQFSMSDHVPYDFLLPVASANILTSYKVDQIATTPGWVHFTDKDKSVIFSCRTYSDNYPDLSRMMELPEDATSFTFPAGIEAMIDRAQIFINAESFIEGMIQLSLEGRKLFVRVKSEGAKFEEWMKSDCHGQNFNTMIHPVFLKDILKRSNTCKIVPGNLIHFESEKWIHVAKLHGES